MIKIYSLLRPFFVLTLLIFSQKSFSQLYISGDWNLGVVMSDSDFNNGATSGAPGIAFGFRAGLLSPEIFYKRFRFDQEESIAPYGDVLTEIKSETLGLGLRLNHHLLLYSKFGVAFHFVEADYASLQSTQTLESVIDKTWASPFVGGGFKYPISPSWEFFTDIAFYLSSKEFSIFNWEFGLRFYLP